MDLHLHDIVELKKAHPCGSTQWESFVVPPHALVCDRGPKPARQDAVR